MGTKSGQRSSYQYPTRYLTKILKRTEQYEADNAQRIAKRKEEKTQWEQRADKRYK